MSSWKKLLLGVTVALVVSLAMLVIAELMLRAFAPLRTAGYHGAYQYDERYGYRLKAGEHHLVLSDHLEELRTNDLGTVNFQESFADYDDLVFTIGDSFTQGTGLGADETYPFQLDMLLNMRGGEYSRRYGVVNLGLAAFGMEQAMLALEEYADRLGAPRFILFLGCSNDLSDDTLFLAGYRHRHLVEGNPNYGQFGDVIRYLLNEVEIGKRLKLMRAEWARRRVLQAQPGDAAADDAGPSIAEQQEARFDRLLAESRRLNATLIVSWTGRADFTSPSYYWLRSWADRNGVAFADWQPMTHSVLRSIPTLPTDNPHSGAHYRTWVNHLIATSFANEIEAHKGKQPAVTRRANHRAMGSQ